MSTVTNPIRAFILIALGLTIAALGIYVSDADDAPGAAAIGMLLMLVGVGLGVKAARNRLPAWAARTAMGIGFVVAAFAAFLSHDVSVRAPLFAQAVPSVAGPAPRPNDAAAVERARELVRAAILEQNLTGVSVAVGAGNAVIWSEGFGWREIVTQTPVTPDTRFNIGTAAAAVTPAVSSLGLTNTGTEPVSEWSPERIGEPEEDFPIFAIIRHIVFRPLGFAPAQPLPGDRATVYAPRSDDDPRRGRRLMSMRRLACCADQTAFYSTPSDLVRFGLATKPGHVNGELAGGTVMSLTTRPDGDLVVAVASNMAYAHTSALAQRISDTFVERLRR